MGVTSGSQVGRVWNLIHYSELIAFYTIRQKKKAVPVRGCSQLLKAAIKKNVLPIVFHLHPGPLTKGPTHAAVDERQV